MSDPGKAVFLSYTSQDVDVARRIADALRAAGVEVWFDQAELRGGDAWDAKIRRQINDCALFVPVISVATQARREGYFRLEWKLAAQRTHMMSERTPFLLPLVIDATSEKDADVPNEFRAVQWTRLPVRQGPEPVVGPGGEATASFSARVKALLGSDDGQASRPAIYAEAGRLPGLPPPVRRASPARLVVVLGVAVGIFAGAFGWSRLRERPDSIPRPGPAAGLNALPAPATLRVANNKSVVVLPLENLSPDPENAFFTDGIHSEIIATLQRLGDLKVISRASSLAFKGTNTPLPVIAEKLSVENVITGNVRRAGTDVRIQLELRRARDDALLWTQTYDKQLGEGVITVQAQIAGDVARVLQIRDRKGRFAGAQLMTKNPQAYDLFFRAMELPTDARLENQVQVIRFAEEALKLDPAFFDAAVLLSMSHSGAYFQESDPLERRRHAEQAKRWGETAAQLMPGGAGDRPLAYFYSVVELDAHRALRLAENAARALPNDSGVHNSLAIALNGVGRVEEALAEYREGLSLDPLGVAIWQNLINWLSRLRREKECEEVIRQCLSVVPGRIDVGRMATARYVLIGSLPTNLDTMTVVQRITWLGRRRDFAPQLAAIEAELVRAATNDRDRFTFCVLQHDALLRLGRQGPATEAARSALILADKLASEMEVDSSEKHGRSARTLARVGRSEEALLAGRRYAESVVVSNPGRVRWEREVELAELCAHLIRPAECVELLARLLRVPSGLTVPMLRVDPTWDKVRDDPGFKALLADPKNSAPL